GRRAGTRPAAQADRVRTGVVPGPAGGRLGAAERQRLGSHHRRFPPRAGRGERQGLRCPAVQRGVGQDRRGAGRPGDLRPPEHRLPPVVPAGAAHRGAGSVQRGEAALYRRSRLAKRTLVLGGARSGKSAHAEGLMPGSAEVVYVATARRHPGDAEWAERIAAHAARRPAAWRTVEAPDPSDLVRVALTSWHARTGELADAVARCTAARLVLVSAEVGLGVVPATRSGRLFRDELGALNAQLAEICDEVTLLVAGLPLQLR